ncbi:TolC family protein [Thermovibrio ammonificans]
MRAVLIALILSLLTVSSRAGELDRLIYLAFSSNKEVQKAKTELKISSVEFKEAVTGYFPKVELSYSRNYLNSVPTYTFSLPGLPPSGFSLFNKSFYQFKVEAVQPLFTGGRVSNSVKLRSFQERASYYTLLEVLNRVAYRVKRSYYNYLKARAMLNVAEATLQAAKAHYAVVKAFYDEGIVARRDLLEAQVKLEEAKQQVVKAKGLVEVAREQLRTVVGAGKLPPLSGRLRATPVSLPPLEELIQRAYRQRPLLKALKAAEGAARSGERLAVSSFMPELLLGISYQRTSQYPGLSPFSSTAVAVTFRFPLFEGGRRFLELEKARLQIDKARLSLERAKEEVRLQVVSAYTEFNSARKQLDVAKKMVEEARELLRDSRERYREHVGTSTEVVDAIAYLQRARSSLVSALADYETALAALRWAVGAGGGER